MTNILISDTKSGHKTATINGIKLHSAYDPIKECERSISELSIGKANLLIVSGIALGYHILEISKRFPNTSILAIDYSSEIINYAQEFNRLSSLGITCVSNKEDAINFIELLDLEKFTGLAHYIHRPSHGLNPEFYDSIVSDCSKLISSRISDLLTRFEFEEKWVENIFLNVPKLSKGFAISNLFNKFKSMPGIIVSAGPSLKKNIKLLKNINDKALILAVDTAFPVLRKHNIVPHLVMTLDAQKFSIKHFLGQYNTNTALIADLVSCPSIIRDFKGTIFFSTTSKIAYTDMGECLRETTPAVDWLEKFILPVGDIQSGGSVATNAFDVLLNLGCNPIILVGQDLAYTGREMHSTGTYHNDGWIPTCSRFLNLDTINQNIIRKRKISRVPAYGNERNERNETAITDFILTLYRTWFENSSKIVPVKVINATEGGAKIENTIEMSLQDVIDSMSQKKSPVEIINNIKTNHINNKNISTGIKNALSTAEELEKIVNAKSDINLYEQTYNILEQFETESLYRPLLRKANLYIARKSFNESDTNNIMKAELPRIINKIKPILEKCLSALK